MFEPDYYKYVVINGEFRFDRGMFASHASLVKTGEVAQSAGEIYVFANNWHFGDCNYSSTLNVNSHAEDQPLLTKLLGIPFVDRD